MKLDFVSKQTLQKYKKQSETAGKGSFAFAWVRNLGLFSNAALFVPVSIAVPGRGDASQSIMVVAAFRSWMSTRLNANVGSQLTLG